MKRIVVIGSTNTDMVIKAARLPAPGETILGGRFLMNPGGKGANQAVAAAKLGGRGCSVIRIICIVRQDGVSHHNGCTGQNLLGVRPQCLHCQIIYERLSSFIHFRANLHRQMHAGCQLYDFVQFRQLACADCQVGNVMVPVGNDVQRANTFVAHTLQHGFGISFGGAATVKPGNHG